MKRIHETHAEQLATFAAGRVYMDVFHMSAFNVPVGRVIQRNQHGAKYEFPDGSKLWVAKDLRMKADSPDGKIFIGRWKHSVHGWMESGGFASQK